MGFILTVKLKQPSYLNVCQGLKQALYVALPTVRPLNRSVSFTCRCSRKHNFPTSSPTLLIRSMFTTFGMEQCRRDDYDPDASLEYSEEETYQQFLDFYEDVLPEFRNVGKVVQFKVRAEEGRLSSLSGAYPGWVRRGGGRAQRSVPVPLTVTSSSQYTKPCASMAVPARWEGSAPLQYLCGPAFPADESSVAGRAGSRPSTQQRPPVIPVRWRRTPCPRRQ